MLLKIGYAIATLLALSFGVHHSRASELEVGRGILCDEAGQMVRFTQLNTGDVQSALEAVNAEFGPTACVPATVAFIRGSVVEKSGSWLVTSILVVGIHTGMGWQRLQPHIYYSAFKEAASERGA